jgi:hypothetical protein
MCVPADGELRKVSRRVLLAERGARFEQSRLTALKSTGVAKALPIPAAYRVGTRCLLQSHVS